MKVGTKEAMTVETNEATTIGTEEAKTIGTTRLNQNRERKMFLRQCLELN